MFIVDHPSKYERRKEDSELSEEEAELRRLEDGEGEVEECEEGGDEAELGEEAESGPSNDDAALSSSDDDDEWAQASAADVSARARLCEPMLLDLDCGESGAAGGAGQGAGACSASRAEPRSAEYAGFTGRGDAEARAVRLIRELLHEQEMLPLETVERELQRQGLAARGGLESALLYLSACGFEWMVTDAGTEGGGTERGVALI